MVTHVFHWLVFDPSWLVFDLSSFCSLHFGVWCLNHRTWVRPSLRISLSAFDFFKHPLYLFSCRFVKYLQYISEIIIIIIIISTTDPEFPSQVDMVK